MKNFFLACKEIRIEPSSPKIYYGSFYLGPFPNGLALTVANALRRTLLSEISGLAITSVKIDGAVHEYSSLSGVRETVLDILLNFKEIVIQKTFNNVLAKTQYGYLQVRGPGIVRARDLKLPPSFVCVDPDQYIATLSEDGILNCVFTIQEGRNFILRKNEVTFSNIDKNAPIKKSDFLDIDAVFTPIKKVNYTIESVGSESLYEANQMVILEIWTNGSVSPQQAIQQTLNYLRILFSELGKLKVFESIATTTVFRNNEAFKKVFEKFDTDLNLLDYNLEGSNSEDS